MRELNRATRRGNTPLAGDREYAATRPPATRWLMALLYLGCAVSLGAGVWQTTPQGARYKDLETGSGEPAAAGDLATMHFIGWLDDGGRKGREIYNTRAQGKPVSFVIGTERVMRGWNEGVTGMRAGGRRLLRLPPHLAYGGRGVTDIIPPNAWLIFLIELQVVEKQPGGTDIPRDVAE